STAGEPFDSDPTNLTVAGRLVYFTARLTQLANELWRTDGTPEGTVKLKDLLPAPGQVGGFARAPANVNGTLMYLTSSGTRQQLWKSDGTPEGTTSVAEFAYTSGAAVGLTAFGGAAYFAAAAPAEAQDVELWKSDGTPGGTVR